MSDKHSISIIDGNPDVLWLPGKLQTKKKDDKNKKTNTQTGEMKKTGKPSLTANIPPNEMFKQSGEYSQFDENGFPTHDKTGKPISQSKMKKLRKQYETHKAIHEKWLNQHKKYIVCSFVILKEEVSSLLVASVFR